MPEEIKIDMTMLTVQLLSAFVANNNVSSNELADLIRSTRAALTEDLDVPISASAPDYPPAVSVRKSLASPEHLLSLIDGKPYKTLKRHLATHGLTEKGYRERYKLPASYPMVAPSYSAARRAVAQKLGLGKRSAAAVSANPGRPASLATMTKPRAADAKVRTRKAKDEPSAPFASDAQVAASPNGAAAAQEASRSPAKRGERKRLSITGPKNDQAGGITDVPNAAAVPDKSAATKKPAKARTSFKPKSLRQL